uniref:Uncharacterized protein n=1 Tax=Anopheles dirus TaxID=7168 RepID=A0A182NTU0_9DIPT
MLILCIAGAVELSQFLKGIRSRKPSVALPTPTPANFRDNSTVISSQEEVEERTMETIERTVSAAGVASGNKKFLFGADASQHSFKTTDKNVTVVCTEGKHDRGSSKIKLVNVVNFKWEQKNYPGRLIACHKDCYLLAYSIRVTKLSKSESMVRVAHLELPERCLIKGLSDDILDLQFSHNSTTECLLGIIERTALHVHQVLVKSEKVTTALKVKIVDPLEGHVPVCDRITWCPYLGDGGGDEMDDFAKQLLVWTRGSTFQCYSISALSKLYLNMTDLKASDIDGGGFKASDGDAIITGSVFSDDGTTLALSSNDGLIRFYQVYQHANDRSPRRLHLWKPHAGKPITSFFFLDNYTETVNNKTIWKHAITCAENNSEIKVWCCESWACLQTIRLVSPVPDATLNFKAEIDISSTYLVLTERSTRQIYVLQIRKGPGSVSPDVPEGQKKVLRSSKPVQPYIVSIAEYPLSTSVLGFAILYATAGNAKDSDYYSEYAHHEQDDDDEEQSAGGSRCVVIRMFLVQPNNLQDCTLMYDALPESDDTETTEVELTEDPEQRALEAPDSQGNSSSVSSSSSSSAASSSNETTDNNVSHPPSEEDDGEVGTEAKGKVVIAEDANTGSKHSNGTDKEEEEEEDDARLKMAEAAQKLNEAFGTICTTVAPSADGSGSAPTTPGNTSSTKVNLMTPDSFSTPASSGVTRSASVKDNHKDVRIINLSELPYPEMETIMNQYDRSAGRRRGRVGAASTNTATAIASGAAPKTTNSTITIGARKNNSSVTSTASANGSVSSDSTDDEREEEEEEEGGGNTSIASVAGSERIANITDDPDDEDGDEIDEVVTVAPKVVVPVLTKGGKKGFPMANGGSKSGADQPKHKKGHAGVVDQQQESVLSISASALHIEHFTKILTLDEAEPPTVREKIKSDDTVNPDVLSTLFMLAKATKQHQQPATAVPEPSTLQTANALEAFVNMVKNRAEITNANTMADDAASSKTKHRKSINGAAAADAPEDSVTDAPVVPPMPSAEMLASGGSSPSREVQQIMSTKGGAAISMVDDMFMYSCVEQKDDDFEDDEEDDDEEGVVNVGATYTEEDGVAVVVANGTVDNSDVADGKDEVLDVSTDTSVLLSGEKTTAAVVALKESIADSTKDELALKKISVMKISGAVLGDSPTTKKARQVEQNDAPSASNFWPATVPTEVPTVASTSEVKPSAPKSSTPIVVPPTVVTIDSNKQLDELNGKLDSMMELLLAQSRQIEEMNAQFEAMKKSKADEQRRTSTMINRINQTLPKMIETQLTQLFMQHALKIDEIMVASFNKQQKLLLETLAHILPQAVLAQLPERLTGILIQELSTKMLPQINAKLDMIKQSVSIDLAEKFRTSEGTIRDATQRAIRSEPFVKTISLSVQSGMRGIMEQAYQESLRTIILPSYDKTAREMFFQLSAAFSEGLKECMHKIDQHIVRVGRTQDRTSEMVEIIRQLPDKLATISERTASTAVRAMRESVEKDLKGLQTPLLKSIRENIRQEIEKGFEVQASSLEDSVLSVVRSQAQTPAPSNADVQEQIKQYLGSGQINKAFHKALLSNDLSLVEFLLERADHKQVFNPCPLEQTVLLSLIQQISADMSNHNELKQKYLSDAIVNLDIQDPITKEHSPKVMLELINNCQSFMAANPSSSLCTSLKMLVIAAQYMGFKNI